MATLAEVRTATQESRTAGFRSVCGQWRGLCHQAAVGRQPSL